jgi:hypothetical protein
MDYVKLINDINANWLVARTSFTKANIAHISDKDTFRGKICGFMTSSYHKRSKLINQGEIYYAYVFKTWTNDNSDNMVRYPTWLLFSPSLTIRENPKLLLEVAKKIQAYTGNGAPDKATEKVMRLIEEPLSDGSYIELPSSLAGNQLVYLSIVYCQMHLNPFFRLGLNLIIAAPSISKEVLYLPEEYMPKEFYEAYVNGGLKLEE